MEATDAPPSPGDAKSTEAAAAALATKADDLESIRKAVEDAASVSAALWVSFLFLSFYLAIAVGAVTHADLLLESPIKLPFLGIELPLLAFFVVAPLLFLIMHAYTLVHFVLLGKKSARFRDALYEQFPGAATARISEAEDHRNWLIREGIRRQLPINIFVQFLAGPTDIRDTKLGLLLKFIAWTTLVFGPIALLLELQIQFLPYHRVEITWEHRLALLVDIVLIWWLWKGIVGDGADVGGRQRLPAWSKTGIGLALSVVAVWFSWGLAIIPGERQHVIAWPFYDALFNGDVDPVSHRRSSLWSNTLVLPRFNIYDVLKVDDPNKLAWRKYLLSVRGRELTGAVFDAAVLERTDAENAHLQGASFANASLQGSRLRDAKLQGASFANATLVGADLIRGQLTGANLIGANLRGANLARASLQGADLFGARLEGTNLHFADLRGARLDHAHIRGASFRGVSPEETKPPRAEETQLQGASFAEATVEVASFHQTLLWRVDFGNSRLATLQGTAKWAPLDRGNARWGPDAYAKLRSKVDDVVDPARRAEALERIARLDCARSEPDIASCNSSMDPPEKVALWQTQVNKAGVDQEAYSKALADVYLNLICSGDGDALAVLRSVAGMGLPEGGGDPEPPFSGFLETGREVKRLVAAIMNQKCPVSTLLMDADKALLFRVDKIAAKSAANSAPSR